jgi:hypothetical protein
LQEGVFDIDLRERGEARNRNELPDAFSKHLASTSSARPTSGEYQWVLTSLLSRIQDVMCFQRGLGSGFLPVRSTLNDELDAHPTNIQGPSCLMHCVVNRNA